MIYAKRAIAHALYRDALDREAELDVCTALETEVVLHQYCDALMLLGADTDELREVHDRIDTIANRADALLNDAAKEAEIND